MRHPRGGEARLGAPTRRVRLCVPIGDAHAARALPLFTWSATLSGVRFLQRSKGGVFMRKGGDRIIIYKKNRPATKAHWDRPCGVCLTRRLWLRAHQSNRALSLFDSAKSGSSSLKSRQLAPIFANQTCVLGSSVPVESPSSNPIQTLGSKDFAATKFIR